jgi:DNA-binding MarR family transcriptional regulator
MPTRGEAILDRPASRAVRESILAIALDLLDEKGLGSCTLPALAERTGIALSELHGAFAQQADLLCAMAESMAAGAIEPAVDGEIPSGWRDLLRRRALNARAAMRSRRDGALLFAALADPPVIPGSGADAVAMLSESGFSNYDARAAIQLIDRFAMGWVIAELTQAEVLDDESWPDFSEQLDTLLTGIGQTRAIGGTAAKNRMFQGTLWVFLRNARDSADIAYSRSDHMSELDRRIMLLLRAQGDLTLAAVSTANGVDKAQISRAIKRLTEGGLVDRGGIRSPLRLSAAGRQLTDRLVRLAELRNRELTFGITDEQLVDLFGVIDLLLTRAMALYEQERKLTQAQDPMAEVDFSDHEKMNLPADRGAIPVDRSRILPPLITLCSYMMRAHALAFKRKTGLSNFDTWVLVEVSRNPPVSWPQLVLALYRDQSQAGRTVKRLIEIGLVERGGKPGRRHGFFSPTPEGARISEIINAMSAKRSEYLFQGVEAGRLANFMAAFDILSRNAAVQLAREKAMQEMDRS